MSMDSVNIIHFAHSYFLNTLAKNNLLFTRKHRIVVWFGSVALIKENCSLALLKTKTEN